MPANLDPDASLMLRVKGGDLRAFEDLVNKYKQPVTNLIYRMLGDAAEAEDLAQSVFVLALHHRPQSLPERNPPSFASPGRIARRASSGIRRSAAPPIRGCQDRFTAGRAAPGRTGTKNSAGTLRTAGEPAHRHPALPAGRAFLRGNRPSARLFALRHQVAYPPRTGNVKAEVEAVFALRPLEKFREMRATFFQLWFNSHHPEHERS